MSLNNTADSNTLKIMAPEEKAAIRSILRNFLQQMGLPFRQIPLDPAFINATVEDGLQHYGLRKEDMDSELFRHSLISAVAITVTTYGHHKDMRIQYWIALYTTYLIFFDDLSVTEPDCLREFHSRFVCAEPQQHPLLDSLASLLRKARECFNPSAANLIVANSLDFITGLILDYDHKQMKVHKSARNYPRYFRTMMGAPTVYAVCIFPPHISVDVYVQVLPDIVNYLDDVNDIFSFYKEELDNEDTNHISLLASVRGWTKIQALQHLADFSVEGSTAAKDVLAAHPEAYEIFTKSFLPGYVGFHAAAAERYKLNELDLAD